MNPSNLKYVADDVEYKVREVVRYVVTRYLSVTSQETGIEGHSSSVVGEFPNYEMAESIKDSLQKSWNDEKERLFPTKINQFVVFKSGYQLDTQLYYEQSEKEATRLAKLLTEKEGTEWYAAKRL